MIKQPDPAWRQAGVLIVAHGARNASQAEIDTRAHADRLRETGHFGQVEVAFLAEGPPLQEILASLITRQVYVLPHFMGEGYFVMTVLPEALGLTGQVTSLQNQSIFLCRPPSTHPDFPSLVEALAVEAAQTAGLQAGEYDLVLAAHGSESNSASANFTEWVAQRISGVRSVRQGFLEQAPQLADVLASSIRSTVVTGLFAANGAHAAVDVPAAIELHVARHSKEADRFFCIYTGAVGASATLTPLFAAQIADFDHRQGPLATST